MSTEPLRFGYTGSVHWLPLLYPLEAGWVYPPGRLVTWHDLPPGEVLARLDAGTLDAALVAPVAYARRRGALDLLPGVGLASEGPTAAAVLQSTERADNLVRLASLVTQTKRIAVFGTWGVTAALAIAAGIVAQHQRLLRESVPVEHRQAGRHVYLHRASDGSIGAAAGEDPPVHTRLDLGRSVDRLR